MKESLSCFKAYDVRGVIGEEISEEIFYRVGRAFSTVLGAKIVIVGRDVRPSSPVLYESIIEGLVDQGTNVLKIGVGGTEEMYWATSFFEACGGLHVTASHNPIDYNGIKFVKKDSKPIDPYTEMNSIKKKAELNIFDTPLRKGKISDISVKSKKVFVEKVLSFVDYGSMSPTSLVINCGNGAVGPVLDKVTEEVKKLTNSITFFEQFKDPDPSFPNGIPNPILKRNHAVTRDKVLETKADFGVAFDGDFDRCFFFDENGDFINGEYIVGLLAEIFLEKEPGGKIVHDHRVIWNSQNIINLSGGIAITSKTGHAFMKAEMRKHDAIYGGELSAHHYFRDFCYCDSGIIPFLLILEYLGKKKESLSKILEKRRYLYPSSGEINLKVSNVRKSLEKVTEKYKNSALQIDNLDGLSMSFPKWRFNLRPSNTEPFLRLNIEAKADASLISLKELEIKKLVENE